MNMKIIERYLKIGLAAALLTVFGELLQGLAPSVSSGDMMTALLESHAALPVWRIGLGSSIGGIGILFQFFGVYAVYLSLNDKENKAASMLKLGAYNYAFVGTVIHILLSVMLYVYKLKNDLLLEFTVYFVTPFLLLFFLGYAAFCALMFYHLFRGKSIFPKWCCILNPLLGKVAIRMISALIPIPLLSNGIAYSNMGISAVVIFTLLLMNVSKKDMTQITKNQ